MTSDELKKRLSICIEQLGRQKVEAQLKKSALSTAIIQRLLAGRYGGFSFDNGWELKKAIEQLEASEGMSPEKAS